MLEDAKTTDIAFLVVGDPFGATTHSDLILRALQEGVSYKVIHNASILNAVGCCGLQLYNFGETVSIVFWTDTWKPDSYCDKITVNRNNGFHTLCLLDIKVKEQSLENLMKGKKIYEPPRYMNVKEAATQLLQVVEKKRDEGPSNLAFDENTICVGLARIGSDTEKLLAGTLHQMAQVDMGLPLHSLVVAGYLHPMELEMLRTFAIDVATFDQLLHERFQDRPWLQDAQ
ncbi:PREDICTED: diphthine methyl ester synthase-like [Priapulus caudatus]|uniref:diphthine methyl ester synthase n=1 Tax=Priapulus caudatus TaxID=37621 RepID=A0ABM1E1A7_PRICU|nr:PREDICTED: diphthine methyl ester synthase-like [Priapulus caudatus]